jgi:Na+-translocating ferredoxin:NAD+ oxidoreductase RnfG subunit
LRWFTTVNDPVAQTASDATAAYSNFPLTAGARVAFSTPAVNVLMRGISFLIFAWAVIAGLGPARAADKDFTPQVYMEIADAPRAVFPKATEFERRDVTVTSEMSQKIKALVSPAKPTIWEPSYITFIARNAQGIVGYAVICEEIGKHYPITFIVGITSDGKVEDVAVMAYREPQGGEVRYKGFLKQFYNKSLKNPIMPYKDIVNVSGATLSTRALARGVRKALAVIQTVYLDSDAKAGGAK